jgi:hypothetical protein
MLALVSPGPAAAGPTDVRASVGAPIRLADGEKPIGCTKRGHVDAQRTIARLQALNANTYAFFVQCERDWDDLRGEFAAAAQAAGLKLWVYLLPPSSCPPKGKGTCAEYGPYCEDYLAWARAIARLSARYPVVTAWVIDDFAVNADTSRPWPTSPILDRRLVGCSPRATQPIFDAKEAIFTPDSMGAIRRESREIQPRLEFYPVVYSDALTSEFVNAYGPTMDAVILPYRDDPYRNTLWTSTLRCQITDALVALAGQEDKPCLIADALDALAGQGDELVLMVYAHPLSDTTVTPDVAYVHRITSIGMQESRAKRIAGVIQWWLPLTPGLPQRNDLPARTGDSVAVLAVDGKKATSAGDWAEASTRIVLDPDSGSPSCRLVAWHTDNRHPNITQVGLTRSLASNATRPAAGVRRPRLPRAPRGYHFKQVVVAGSTVWERDVAVDQTAWEGLGPLELLELSPQLQSDGKAELSLRLYEKAGSKYRVRARFDDVTLTGCHTDGDPGFERNGAAWVYSRRGAAGSGDGPVIAGHHTYHREYSTRVFDAVRNLYCSILCLVEIPTLWTRAASTG